MVLSWLKQFQEHGDGYLESEQDNISFLPDVSA